MLPKPTSPDATWSKDATGLGIVSKHWTNFLRCSVINFCVWLDADHG